LLASISYEWLGLAVVADCDGRLVRSKWRCFWSLSQVQRPDRGMGGVGCHHLASSTRQMSEVVVLGVGRVWSMVREVSLHVGNMVWRLLRIEEKRRCAGSCVDWAKKGSDCGQNSTLGLLRENEDGAKVMGSRGGRFGDDSCAERCVFRGARVRRQVWPGPWRSRAWPRPRLLRSMDKGGYGERFRVWWGGGAEMAGKATGGRRGAGCP
jgi:hypothetical protein